MIYNDTRDLNSGAVHVPFFSRFPVSQTFDNTGKMIDGHDVPNAGVGGSKTNCFELDTSFQVPVNENTFIVRSKCGSKARYGYMTFQ